jgi:hypothetical protein
MIQAVAARNNAAVPLGEAIGHEHARDPSEDLAAWLTEAGRRAWHPAQTPAKAAADGATESSGQLVGYLEELAGRKFVSREDIRRYVDEYSTRAQKSSQAQRRRQVLRDTVLLFCLLSAYIQYNFLDVSLQIARLPSSIIFVPVEAMDAPVRSSVRAELMVSRRALCA